MEFVNSVLRLIMLQCGNPNDFCRDVLINMGNPDVSPNNTLLASESVVY